MKILSALFVLCGLSCSAVALDREAFTFTKYDLEVRLEPEQQRLGARGTIRLRNDSDRPQKNAVLQISSSLSWRAIKVAGKPVQFVTQTYVSDIDHTAALSEAIVTLPAEVKPKESVELEIGYEGIIKLDTTRLTQIGVPENIARHTSWDQISPSFTAVRGAGYVAWYPIATVAADFSEGNSLFQVTDRWLAREAESEFRAHVSLAGASTEGPPILLCGANEGFSAEYGRNWALGSDCNTKDLGTITPTFLAARYQVQSTSPMSVYVMPGHDLGAAAYSTALDPASKFVSEWFGPPTTPIAVADLADPNAAPFESGTLLLASMAGDDRGLAQLNLVHLLVHSAFSSRQPWIHEGLAHFAEALYRAEKQDGRQAALDSLGLHRATFLDAEKEVAGGKNPGQPLATTYDESYYRSKAAYVWWMLRDMMGDDALKQALKNYRAKAAGDSKYMERLLSATSKRDLSWFFEDWVYHDRGLPDFRVLTVHPWKSEAGKPIVTVTIENLGNAGAEVPFTVRFGDGEITRRLEVRSKSTATTRVEVPATATEIVVNDGSVPESELTNNVFKISGQ